MEHMKDDIDILVIGSGTAGTIAAIQAGRTGLRTTLVESGNQLGGVTTTGGVSFPGLFHDRLANSALRVQASSMAMGQTAGAAAALSVRLETTPREVPLPDLRELLVLHDAVVPGANA